MISGILLGLTAALCWGTADFFARGATRAAGTFVTLLVVQAVAVAAFLLGALPLGILRFSPAPAWALVGSVVLNLLILAGAGLLYIAFATGTLAVVAPIAASFGALTVLLSLLTGERPSAAQLVGMVVTLIGVVLVSLVPAPEETATKARSWRPAPGVVQAFGALVLFGVSYWGLRYVVAPVGGIQVAFLAKAADLVVLGAIALLLPAHRALLTRPPGKRFWLFVVPTALLDTAANVAYNVGITLAYTSIVAALGSLFSAVTILLAWLVLGERLTRIQWLGIGAILLGIVAVNF